MNAQISSNEEQIAKIDELLQSIDESCWIEDGVSDLTIGWIEPELAKIDYDFHVYEEAYEQLSIYISYLCKGFIKDVCQTQLKKLQEGDK